MNWAPSALNCCALVVISSEMAARLGRCVPKTRSERTWLGSRVRVRVRIRVRVRVRIRVRVRVRAQRAYPLMVTGRHARLRERTEAPPRLRSPSGQGKGWGERTAIDAHAQQYLVSVVIGIPTMACYASHIGSQVAIVSIAIVSTSIVSTAIVSTSTSWRPRRPGTRSPCSPTSVRAKASSRTSVSRPVRSPWASC